MCFFWPPEGSSLIPALQATVSYLNKIVVSTVHGGDKFLPFFPAQWCVSPLCVFFFLTGNSAPLSRMVVSGLDLEQNVRSGLVPVITLGLWVRLDNVSLW